MYICMSGYNEKLAKRVYNFQEILNEGILFEGGTF